jgi:hypothetical protein
MPIDLIKLEQETFIGQRPIVSPTKDVWIAGGAIRQWFNDGELLTDIDVFGKNQESLDNFISEKLWAAKKISEQNHLSSFSLNGQLIQVIKYDYYDSIHNLLDSFDFTVCQFAWDGKTVYSTEAAIVSVLRKHLRVHKITKELAADSLRRAFKYQRKGYIPCLGTLKDIMLSFQNLTEEQIKEQITISPGGGTRFVGVD